MEQTGHFREGRGGERPSRLRGNVAVGLGDEDSRDNAEMQAHRWGGGAEKEGRLVGSGLWSGKRGNAKGQTALSRSPVEFGRDVWGT